MKTGTHQSPLIPGRYISSKPSRSPLYILSGDNEMTKYSFRNIIPSEVSTKSMREYISMMEYRLDEAYRVARILQKYE